MSVLLSGYAASVIPEFVGWQYLQHGLQWMYPTWARDGATIGGEFYSGYVEDADA